jgi:hypothetical protein
MRIHPKVITENFEKGIYVESWKGYDADLILCFYSDNLNIGEERYKACVNKAGGPMTYYWWDLSEIAKLSEDEVNELMTICAYKKYIEEEFDKKDIVKRLATFFECDTSAINRKGTPALMAKRKPLTPEEEHTLNPFYLPSYSEFISKSNQ